MIKLFKIGLMMLAGMTVVPFVDWIEDLKDRRELRWVNKRRVKKGEEPFDNLWQYYNSLQNRGGEP